jgi:hypothetical protein
MELKEFIKSVLADITGAVDESTQSSKKYAFSILRKEHGDSISFDIALAVNEKTQTATVAGMSVETKDDADALQEQNANERTNEQIHGLRFDIRVNDKDYKGIAFATLH